MTLNNDLFDDNVLIDRVYLGVLPEPIFSDGFEDGDTLAWSDSSP